MIAASVDKWIEHSLWMRKFRIEFECPVSHANG